MISGNDQVQRQILLNKNRPRQYFPKGLLRRRRLRCFQPIAVLAGIFLTLTRNFPDKNLACFDL